MKTDTVFIKDDLNLISKKLKSSLTGFEEFKTILLNDMKIHAKKRMQKCGNIELTESVGRVLASNIKAQYHNPPYSQSAMDGYCVKSSDLVQQVSHFHVVGESLAGHPYIGKFNASAQSESIRIMTGAQIPDHFDHVVMKEFTLEESDRMRIVSFKNVHELLKKNNIRSQGEDFKKGEILLQQGHSIRIEDIPLLASQGNHMVSVYDRLKIGVVSCGDELLAPEAKYKPGKIYDQNKPMLIAQLKKLNMDVQDYGILPDDKHVIEKTLLSMQACDVIISSGGASVGEYDFFLQAVQNIGQIQQYKIAMKPGKPLMTGSVGSSVYFGLPGNPLSSYVCFEVLVKPALAVLSLCTQATPVCIGMPLACSLDKKGDRLEFQRGYITEAGVFPFHYQDSHRIKDLSHTQVLIKIPAEKKSINKGEILEVILV